MPYQYTSLIHGPWQRLKNMWQFVRVLFEGDRFEWDIDLKKAKRPVLLIHGFAMPRQCMAHFENWLKEDGYDVFAFRLGPANFLGVDKAARIIGMKLRHLQRAHGLKKLAIVGHSLGGIIGRAYICLRKGDRIAHTLITLGSPHRGHPAGAFWRNSPIGWLTHVPRTLAPDSQIMKLLRLNPIPPYVYGVSIFSDGDHICPAEICPIDMPVDVQHIVNIMVKNLGHVDLMLDREVYKLVRQHLSEGFRRSEGVAPDDDETLTLPLEPGEIETL